MLNPQQIQTVQHANACLPQYLGPAKASLAEMANRLVQELHGGHTVITYHDDTYCLESRLFNRKENQGPPYYALVETQSGKPLIDFPFNVVYYIAITILRNAQKLIA